MGYKFASLSNYFSSLTGSRVCLSFAEIEAIIGQKLCPSAYIYDQYWRPSATHTITRAWLNQGWEMSRADLAHQIVEFVRR